MQASQSDAEKLHGAIEVIVRIIINNLEALFPRDDDHFYKAFLQSSRALVPKKMCLLTFYVDATNK